MRRVVSCIILILICGISANLFAQDKPKNDDEEIVKIDTRLVDVPIVVTDKNGKPLLNLKQNNFVVFEDGKLQEVLDFSTTKAPFEVALLLDTSGSTRSDLQLIQRSALNFINSLRPGDRVSIISFKTDKKEQQTSAATDILIGLTDDRNALKGALDQVKTSNGTPYYDALSRVIEEVFDSKPAEEFRGRRALVALTDGVDSTSVSDFSEVREGLEKAGIVTYFIQVNTRDFFEQNLLGDCGSVPLRFSLAQIRRYYRRFDPKSKIERTDDFCQLGDFEKLAISKRLYELADAEMNDLAKISGGKVFPVADLTEARNAFKSVADEIGTKYSLGYYSSNEKKDGTYRKIKVEIKGVSAAGLVIRAREGYTAPVN